MEYLIYRTKIPSQYIDLQLTLEAAANETITLQLPSWRPGRYELAIMPRNQEVFISLRPREKGWHCTRFRRTVGISPPANRVNTASNTNSMPRKWMQAEVGPMTNNYISTLSTWLFRCLAGKRRKSL